MKKLILHIPHASGIIPDYKGFELPEDVIQAEIIIQINPKNCFRLHRAIKK